MKDEDNQKMSFEGIPERGSARISARAPWRRARATRPEKDIFDYPRGYQKIKGASVAFNFDFRDKTVLDIGSSTGGFTQFALDSGAKKVIAVEKGTNQMMAPLRFDPRVDLHEKTDIFDIKFNGTKTPENVHSRPSATNEERIERVSPVTTGANERVESESFLAFPDIILADVSFLSLTKILKYAKINLARSNTDFLVMLKPQFEANPSDLNKGVVKNEKIRRQVIKNFEQWLKQNGFIIIKKRDNTLAGKSGNIERFYWLKLESK